LKCQHKSQAFASFSSWYDYITERAMICRRWLYDMFEQLSIASWQSVNVTVS